MRIDQLDLAGLAEYLQRDARELAKLASQGRLPGRRIAGEWKFNRSEVNEWLERELHKFSDEQLANVETGVMVSAPLGHGAEPSDLLVTRLMGEATTAVPLDARTASGVLSELVQVANGNWQIYDPDKILAALRVREEMSSTALPGGVAIPHPRQPQPDALGDSLIAYGRTLNGIVFGGPSGMRTDIFFLVLCRDDRLHLQVLARLARMFQRPTFLDDLRAAPTAVDTLACIADAEEATVNE